MHDQSRLPKLNLKDINDLLEEKRAVKLSDSEKKKVNEAFTFLKEFSKNKVIYGINTGFGPMAQYRISDEDLNQLQYNLIRSHANGMGPALTQKQTRAVMICRLNTLALGFSGTKLDVLETLQNFINLKIYPIIPQHGGVGASGDLVQLAHLALGLIGEGKVYFQDKIIESKAALAACNISAATLTLRDGLSLINGTSCMSAIASINLIQVSKLLNYSILASSIMNELTASYDDSFSPELNNTKLHRGQQLVAEKMRENLNSGNVLKSRTDHLFNETHIKGQDYFKEKVQEYYSLRCVPQIIGPILDTYLKAKHVLEREINSANDNPIVRADKNNIFHGGNFHGDYIAMEMDKLKIGVAKLSMLMERQLNYLLNEKLNQKFPPFLNVNKLGFNFGLQGMQFAAVSTTAENQTLSNPMSIHSIPNNGDNQDIVSMGTNAALIAQKVIDNTFEVLTIHLVAIAQAIDIDNNLNKLSDSARKVHSLVRKHINIIEKDQPQSESLACLKTALLDLDEKIIE